LKSAISTGGGEDLRIVIKLGGSLLTEARLLEQIVRQLLRIQAEGHELILVHGGGKQIKQYLEKLRIPSRFHQGLRITDAATMEVVQMVLAGLVNKQVVAAFAAAGKPAVGICGGDGLSFTARKFASSDDSGSGFDYGFVGEIHQGNPALVKTLLHSHFTPVIACIGMDSSGTYYNVNADEMAAAVAIFCEAERLVFLTDVPGVLDANRAVIPRLERPAIQRLREAGIITEGMLPKTRACERALESGLQQIHILGGREPEGLIRVLTQEESLGTTIC
jgi:acetylglutamate kinase